MIASLTKRVLAIYIGLLVIASIGAAFIGGAGKLAFALHGGQPSSLKANGEPDYQLTDVVVMPDAEPATWDEF